MRTDSSVDERLRPGALCGSRISLRRRAERNASFQPLPRQVVVSYRSAEQLAALERSGHGSSAGYPPCAARRRDQPSLAAQAVLRRSWSTSRPSPRPTSPGSPGSGSGTRRAHGRGPGLGPARGLERDDRRDRQRRRRERAPDLADKSPRPGASLTARTRCATGSGTARSSPRWRRLGRERHRHLRLRRRRELLVVQAIDADGYITDVDEAAAIVYAVKHGAKIVNLSSAARRPRPIEQRAIRWAARRGVLIVAAAGNEHDEGNLPSIRPRCSSRSARAAAAGSASPSAPPRWTARGRLFSNTGSYLSLAAPGYNVFAAESADATGRARRLPWSSPGYYGWASGTSFAAPQVAGAAALVWAANPRLTAQPRWPGCSSRARPARLGTASSAGAASTPLRRSSSRSRRRAWRSGRCVTNRGRSTPRRPRRPPSSRAAPSP